MTLGKVSTPSSKTRDKLGAFLGKSGRTLEKQVALVEAAEAEPAASWSPTWTGPGAWTGHSFRRSMPDPDIDALEVEGRTGRLDFRSQIMKPIVAKPLRRLPKQLVRKHGQRVPRNIKAVDIGPQDFVGTLTIDDPRDNPGIGIIL